MTTPQTWNAAKYQERHSYVFRYGEEVLPLLDPKPGESILDLGCGAGHLTAAIAKAGAKVIGLDASHEMLTQARENFPEIEFRLGDAANFTVDEPLDAIFSNAALHWVKDREGVVRSVSKALKPGGRFVAEMGGHGNIQTVIAAIREELGPIEIPWSYPTIGEYASLLEKQGVETQQAWLFDRPTRVEGEDGMEDWLVMYCGNIFSTFTPDQQKQAIHGIAEKLRHKLYQNGVWTLDYRRLRIVAKKTTC